MTANEDREPHRLEADGWCSVCCRVGCGKPAARSVSAGGPQLARIEAKLNRLLRVAGIDPDTGQPTAKETA